MKDNLSDDCMIMGSLVVQVGLDVHPVMQDADNFNTPWNFTNRRLGVFPHDISGSRDESRHRLVRARVPAPTDENTHPAGSNENV